MKPINVGLLGIGTVGGGTFAVLARNRDEIERRAGRGIRITRVADKDVERWWPVARHPARRRRRWSTTPSPWCATRTSTSSSN
jgi:homoserine dehydrogenase